MTVLFADEQHDPLETEPLISLARSVLEAEALPDSTEVSIVLIDRDRMAGLNREHMGKDATTDVLSFPIEDLAPGVVPEVDAAGPPLTIGDVLICPSVVRENAKSNGVPFDDEMALMVVHGILHLLGYDHVDDTDAEHMEGRERALLAAVGRTRP